MNEIEGNSQNMPRNIYDRTLLERVKQFQAAQGLIDDVVVGVKTIIRINQVLGLTDPVLEPTNYWHKY